MTNNDKGVLGLSRSLFWDVDPDTVDPEKHAVLIIERVVTRGSWEEFKTILSFYSKQKVADILTQLRYLEKVTLYFCSTYFNISLKKFKCYILQQSNQSHWDY